MGKWSGQRIKALRQKYNGGMTQEQFAPCIGVAVQTLRDWEQGSREANQTAQILLDCLAREHGAGVSPPSKKKSRGKAVAA